MKLFDWLRGDKDDEPADEKPKPEGDWQEEEELPGDEDDPTVYPLW